VAGSEGIDLSGRPLLLGPDPGTASDRGQEWQLLRRCRYALCPTAHPDRLWRVLAAGAVPVLVGEAAWLPEAGWLLPGLPGAWGEAVLVSQGEEPGALAERLRAIGPLAWRARQLIGGRLLRAARWRTCFGIPAPAGGEG
jgi:hypothetical protein